MKTIGLLGGMSWESTALYYRIINETVKEALGGLNSAKCVLYSVNFHEIEALQARGDWDAAALLLSQAALLLEKAGCDLLVICTNTMHCVYDAIQSRLSIPILHIATLTADALLTRSIQTVALLGTRYTMEQDFYKQKLIERGIAVLTPEAADRAIVHDCIYHELCLGVIRETSRREFLRIIDSLATKGAQGVILGCTEIGLLVKQSDTHVPLFDTTAIHAERAAKYALED